jgi:hypothetical protein
LIILGLRSQKSSVTLEKVARVGRHTPTVDRPTPTGSLGTAVTLGEPPAPIMTRDGEPDPITILAEDPHPMTLGGGPDPTNKRGVVAQGRITTLVGDLVLTTIAENRLASIEETLSVNTGTPHPRMAPGVVTTPWGATGPHLLATVEMAVK